MSQFKEYTIRGGDNLYMIAQRELGDASLAMDIATLNDLEYPFIVPLGQERENVKTIGDTIFIPISIVLGESADTIGIYDAFGSDLYLSTDMFALSLNRGGELDTDHYGDLRIADGINSLTLDLTHRLLTEKGTLPFHPEYGSDLLTLIGSKRVLGWEQKIQIEASRVMLCDDRVVSIQGMYISLRNTAVIIDCTVVTNIGEIQFKEHIGDVKEVI